MRIATIGALLVVVSLSSSAARAQEGSRGHLLIVGGGLRPDNAAVFQRLIRYAGGEQSARFGIFPTASLVNTDARQLKLVLGRLGVPAERAQVIDITVANASRQVVNPKIIDQIRACTAIYFEGGDQTRITRSLYAVDGSPTPALRAIYEAWNRGAVIAGSSAGAAVQSKTMISAGGLPDETLDEGMDTLDFGLTTNVARRGLFVSPGLAFFEAGIIDQHFGQYRGRLGRLSRVVVERQTGLGFGIDENTALDVAPDGSVEVVGAGTVTIVDGTGAKLEDGPLGCRISGVRLSCLADGDRFDTRSGQATPRPEKAPIAAGKESSNGNFLIPDINGRGAALDAICAGLADNTARTQVGVALKFNRQYAHGYRFTFHKTDATRSFDGYLNGLYSVTVLNVLLDIAPIDGTLRPPESRWPRDLSPTVSAVFHRGILQADNDNQLRLADSITRAELASAITQTIHLEPPRGGGPVAKDVPADSPLAEVLRLVLGNRLMELDRGGEFHPEQPVSRIEGAAILVRVAERYSDARLSSDPVSFDDVESLPAADRAAAFAAIRSRLIPLNDASFHAARPLTRQATAEALYRLLGFSW